MRVEKSVADGVELLLVLRGDNGLMDELTTGGIWLHLLGFGVQVGSKLFGQEWRCVWGGSTLAGSALAVTLSR